jgi:SAM-dependent methyltransferase
MKDRAEFDQYADTYDARLNLALAASGESKEFYARGRVEWLALRLAQLRQRPATVLDYGCGIGGTTRLLHETLRCNSTIGLDISERSLERARQEHGSTCRFLTFAEYTPEASVDVVYCNGVFHHIPIPERSAAVRYIHQSLRPGGVFALWENNPWNPGTQYVMHKCDFDRDAIKIPPPEAKRLLAAGGFKLLFTDYRFFFPRFLKGLRFMEDSLVRLPLGGQYQVIARKSDAK